jgi:hypothetical protein
MKNRQSQHRDEIREKFWPGEKAWTGENRRGWFRAPRTLPLLLVMLQDKRLTGSTDVAPVYLGLWARHWDGGVIEIPNEDEMAYEAGYTRSRGTRTWRERMELLERLGFIKTKEIAGQRYRLVLLIDPSVVVEKLAEKNLISSTLLDTYNFRRLKTREDEPVEVAKPKVLAMRPKVDVSAAGKTQAGLVRGRRSD